MGSIDEVRTAIARSLADSEQAISGTRAVNEAVADTLTLGQSTSAGSQNAKVLQGLAKLDEAQDEVRKVLRLLDASITAAREYQRGIIG